MCYVFTIFGAIGVAVVVVAVSIGGAAICAAVDGRWGDRGMKVYGGILMVLLITAASAEIYSRICK